LICLESGVACRVIDSFAVVSTVERLGPAKQACIIFCFMPLKRCSIQGTLGNKVATSTATFTDQLSTGIDWQQQYEQLSSSRCFVLRAVQAKLTGVMFRALDMLEAELATICPMEGVLPQTYRGNQEQDLHKLRLLLERECAAQVSAIICANTSLALCMCCL